MKNSPSGSGGLTDADFIDYHQDLILACRTNRFDRRDGTPLEDLEVLADLQHHMAATCLIDFTRSALVALWFACEESGEDGKVFVVNTADEERFLEVTPADILGNSISKILKFETRETSDSQTEESATQDGTDLIEEGPKFWRWTPASLNERIPAQHSLFVFGPLSSGMPETEEIIIESLSKEEIREELKDVHDIYEATLFPDFAGFAYTHRHEALYGPSAAEYYRRGVKVQQRGERLEVAIEHFNIAIQLKPDDPRSYRARGNAYLRLRGVGNAIQDFSKLIELNPDDARAYRARGNAYLRLREVGSAISDFTQLTELNPDHASGYRLRGRAYEREGSLDKAKEDYSKAVEKDPEYGLAYILRGRVYEREGDLDRANKDYSKMIELDKDSPSGYRLRGGIYEKQGKLDEAKEDYSRTIELMPDSFRAYFLRGNIHNMQVDVASAVQDFNMGLALDNLTVEGILRQARKHFESDSFDIAKTFLDKAIESTSHTAENYGFRAVVQLCLEQWESARTDFSTAADLGLDVAAYFEKEFGTVTDFQIAVNIQLPADIVSVLEK